MSGVLSDTEKSVGETISRPYFRLAFIIVCLVLLSFVAIKEGFSIWLLSKLNLSKSERLSNKPTIAEFYPPGADQKAANLAFQAATTW